MAWLIREQILCLFLIRCYDLCEFRAMGEHQTAAGLEQVGSTAGGALPDDLEHPGCLQTTA